MSRPPRVSMSACVLSAGSSRLSTHGSPIVAKSEVANLIIATGHHRKGILLAPLAAATVASLIETAG